MPKIASTRTQVTTRRSRRGLGMGLIIQESNRLAGLGVHRKTAGKAPDRADLRKIRRQGRAGVDPSGEPFQLISRLLGSKGGLGNFLFSPSRVSTRISETARLRNHSVSAEIT